MQDTQMHLYEEMWSFEDSILLKTQVWKSSAYGIGRQVENLGVAGTFGRKKGEWRKKGDILEVGDILEIKEGDNFKIGQWSFGYKDVTGGLSWLKEISLVFWGQQGILWADELLS